MSATPRRTGHLDFDSGKWVDDPPPAALPAERSVEVKGDGLVYPSRAGGSPPAPPPQRSVEVGPDALVRPAPEPTSDPAATSPMQSAADRARELLQRRSQTMTGGRY